MVSNKFKELVFFNYQQNNVLVYPSTLKIESLVIDNFELKRNLNVANQMSLDDETKPVTIAAKLLN